MKYFSNIPYKYFKTYIKCNLQVLAGKYENDTGLVVRVEDHVVILFSDISMHEMEVLPENLQLCPDVASGVDKLGKFQHGDLVEIEAQKVGVIVRISHDVFQVLSMHGKIIDVKPASLVKFPDNRNSIALDMHQDQIRRRDIVKVIDGPHSGREGEIKHIYRNFAFLYSKMYIENGGIFVTRTKYLELVGGTRATGTLGLVKTAVYASPTRSER